MTASTVDICNQALLRIGASRITSLGDDTEEAILCNLLYTTVVEETIGEGMWSRALVRATLNKTTNTPVYGFSNEFQLPTSPAIVNILSVNETEAGSIEYAIEGDKLITDEGSIKIQYTGFIEDPAKYGPHLRQAIVSRLAAELAFPITGDQRLSDRMFQKYSLDVEKGLTFDNQQGTSIRIVSDDLLDVRISGDDY